MDMVTGNAAPDLSGKGCFPAIDCFLNISQSSSFHFSDDLEKMGIFCQHLSSPPLTLRTPNPFLELQSCSSSPL